jgi:hypothetical protein
MRLLIAAAALALLPALPAQAQADDAKPVADTLDTGDWWWLDVSGSGPSDALILVNGEGVRSGDLVTLNSFIIYREPKKGGYVGAHIISVVDCRAKTDSAELDTLLLADMRMVRIESLKREMKPLDPGTVLYQFACTDDREQAHHLGRGSRRAFAAGIFTEHPPR